MPLAVMDRRPGSSRVICSTRQPGIGQSLFILRSMGSDASPFKHQAPTRSIHANCGRATLEGQAPATRANATAALKSLFSFAQETGYLRFNLGKVLKAPPVKNMLAERILDEAAVHRMLALETSPRNRALLTLLYGGGLRISEVTGLRWRDLTERDGAGQVTVYGKGGKTRVVLLSAGTWTLLSGLRGAAGLDEAVFRSRKGG